MEDYYKKTTFGRKFLKVQKRIFGGKSFFCWKKVVFLCVLVRKALLY